MSDTSTIIQKEMRYKVLALFTAGYRQKEIISITGASKGTVGNQIFRYKKERSKELFFNESDNKNWLL